MKMTKKVLSVFLAMLMIASSLVCGMSAVAAEDKYAKFITALKDGSNELDNNREYYVKDLNNYTVVNETDDWSDEGNTVAYKHSVTAKDNYSLDGYGLITRAAQAFYAIVNDVKSYQYGVGGYNTEEIAKIVKSKIYPQMSGSAHLVRTNDDGTKLYVAPTNVLIDQGSDDIITIDQYSYLRLQATVMPQNVSNGKIFWRVISGSSYVDVDQNGRVYAFRPTPADDPAILEAIAVDSITVTKPAVYDAAGNVVAAPQFDMNSAKSTLFYVAVKDIVFNDPVTGVTTADSSPEERALANYDLEALPNHGKTPKQIWAELAEIVPPHLDKSDAVVMTDILRKETLSDADYGVLAGYCYSAVQEAVLAKANVNIADLDMAHLSASGLDSAVITAIKEIVRDQAAAFLDSCNWTDEYSFFNAEALVNYYLGNGGVVNNANWFHTFIFTVETDVETVMIDLFKERGGFQTATTTYPSFYKTRFVYEWKHVREYDESGTKPRYVLDSDYYKVTSTRDIENTAFNELSALNEAAEGLYATVGGGTPNPALLSSEDARFYSADMDAAMNAVAARGYSTELIEAAFGNKYYWILSQYNTYRGNYTYDQAVAAGLDYPQLYGYRENVRYDDKSESKNPYSLTANRMSQITGTIDAMLTDPKVAQVISGITKFDSGRFAGTPIYGAEYGVNYNTAKELLQLLIKSLLYTDRFPTMIFEKIYDLLVGLVEETVVDAAKGVEYLGTNLYNTINAVTESDLKGVEDVILYILNDQNIYIYPYDVVNCWDSVTRNKFKTIYDMFNTSYWEQKKSGFKYVREHAWDDVTDEMWETISQAWQVNGSRDRFKEAMTASLYGVIPLLKPLLTDKDLPTVEVPLIGLNLKGYIDAVKLYEVLVAPLLDALGITPFYGAKTVSQYNALPVNQYLNALLDPILDWVEEYVLENPIQAISEILVNLSSLLRYNGGNSSYHGFVEYACHRIPGDQITLRLSLFWGAWKPGIKLLSGGDLYEKLADFLKGADITSINGILEFIQTLKPDLFEAPIVAGYDPFGAPIFVHKDDPTQTTADENLAKTMVVKLPAIQDAKLWEAGTLISSFSSPLGAGTFADVHYDPVDSGQVLLYLLRYILYGIMSTNYAQQGGWLEPSLLDCFLSPWKRNGGINITIPGVDTSRLQSVTINRVINNIVFHPEEALCALAELLQPNETSTIDYTSLYGKVYALAYPDYQQKVLLDRNGKPKHKKFGSAVKYTEYWTEENAEDSVANITEIVNNVLRMLGYGSVNNVLEGLLDDNLFTNDILSKIAAGIYTSLEKIQRNVDLKEIMKAAFDVQYDCRTLYNTLAYNIYTKYDFGDATFSQAPEVLREMSDSIRLKPLTDNSITEDMFYKSERVQATDGDGNPLFDSDNNPIWATQEQFITDGEGNKVQKVVNGEPVFDDQGNPVYETETVDKTTKVAVDWGMDPEVETAVAGRSYENASGTEVKITRQEVFFNALEALLSPMSLLLERLLLGRNLNVFTSAAHPDGLLTIPMYQVYHYAIIPLYEALGMTGISSFSSVASKLRNHTTPVDITGTKAALAMDPTNHKGAPLGAIEMVHDIIQPVRNLLNAALADPIGTIFDIIPNLMFVISVGTINDIVNNIAHFAYVLLDILSPVLDVLPFVNGILNNIKLMNIPLNLSLPLNVDFNTLINQLLGSFTTGTVAEDALQGNAGVEVTDGLYIKFPPLDLSMLCAGQITAFNSASNDRTNPIVRIGTGSGADLLTVLLTFVMDTVFMQENISNVANWLGMKSQTDTFDRETIRNMIMGLYDIAIEKNAPDRAMSLIYVLLKYVAPLSGEVADRLEGMGGITIMDFFNNLKEESKNPKNLIKYVMQFVEAKPSEKPTVIAGMSFFQRLILFFQRLIASIKAIFTGGKKA
ncbi:MAG: hypothetical protein IJL26_05465 [Clostridia bacterium]|nr:hypothetical protein [Clostridia bacterium]